MKTNKISTSSCLSNLAIIKSATAPFPMLHQNYGTRRCLQHGKTTSIELFPLIQSLPPKLKTFLFEKNVALYATLPQPHCPIDISDVPTHAWLTIASWTFQ